MCAGVGACVAEEEGAMKTFYFFHQERSKASDRSAKGDAENESLKMSDSRLRSEIKK